MSDKRHVPNLVGSESWLREFTREEHVEEPPSSINGAERPAISEKLPVTVNKNYGRKPRPPRLRALLP